MPLAAGFGDGRRVPNKHKPFRVQPGKDYWAGTEAGRVKSILKVIRAGTLKNQKTIDFACDYQQKPR
jgi:hypothetical protein